MLDKIKESRLFLENRLSGRPKIAVVLGSGLGALIQQIEILEEVEYASIPHFTASTVAGHKGTLIHGRLNKVELLILNGRTHYYEGLSMSEIVFPIRVLHALGIQTLILSNAAGGLNPSFAIGDVMIMKDHLNFFGDNPLIGKNYDELGPRFPSMNEPYSHRIIRLAHEIAKKHALPLQQGVYAGVSGPNFETPAECKAFYIMGADAIGMSTIPENIAARHLGMEVFALSVITDLAVIGQMEEISHEEVLKAASIATPTMVKLIQEMISYL